MGKRILFTEETGLEDRKNAPDVCDEQREKRLCNMAFELAEQRMREGKATSQEICFFLKLGSQKNRLEEEKLEHDAQLSKAKADAIRTSQESDINYTRVIEALTKYRGTLDSLEDSDYTDAITEE